MSPSLGLGIVKDVTSSDWQAALLQSGPAGGPRGLMRTLFAKKDSRETIANDTSDPVLALVALQSVAADPEGNAAVRGWASGGGGCRGQRPPCA